MRTRGWAGVIATLGVLFTGSMVWHLVVLDAPVTGTFHDLITLVLVGGAGLGLLYAAYWHGKRTLAAEYHHLIAAWMAASTLLFVSTGTISLYSGSQRVLLSGLIEAVHIAGSVGIVVGLLVGTIQAQAIRSAEAAARAEAKAQAIEDERERLDRLNDLLRHHVLNGMQLVTGYATQLRETVPAENQATLDIIEERANAIVMLIEHVRSVSGIIEDDTATGAVDLGSAIDAAVAEIDSRFGVTIDAPEETPEVRANNLSEALILLCEALATITEEGAIRISRNRQTPHVTLTIATTSVDGSRPIGESVFELSGSIPGLKLYLAKAIIEEYGELDLTEQADGVVELELTLDRATRTRVARP